MDGHLRWLRSRVGHDKIQLVFAIACVLREDAVLLQHRADTGGWGFPGGAVELGESAHDAAVRETREETGVVVTIRGLIGVYTAYEQSYPNGDVAQPVLIAFRAEPSGAPRSPAEPGGARRSPAEPGGTAADDDVSSETLESRYVALTEVPRLFNQQHQDVLADLIAGRTGVYR